MNMNSPTLIRETIETVFNVDLTNRSQEADVMIAKNYYRFFVCKYAFNNNRTETANFLDINYHTLRNSLGIFEIYIRTHKPFVFYVLNNLFRNNRHTPDLNLRLMSLTAKDPGYLDAYYRMQFADDMMRETIEQLPHFTQITDDQRDQLMDMFEIFTADVATFIKDSYETNFYKQSI